LADQQRGVHVYTAKFLCGVFDRGRASDQGTLEGPVRPGRYTTAINVHNPHPRNVVKFRKKAVLLFRGDSPEPPNPEDFERPHPPGRFHEAELEADHGMEIDCADIRLRLLAPPEPAGPGRSAFIKGWVVLEVWGTTSVETPLDVVAVYTADPIEAARGQPGQGLALQVERIPGVFIPF
jgi:hypothetical protein